VCVCVWLFFNVTTLESFEMSSQNFYGSKMWSKARTSSKIRVGTKISMIYINDICHDSIMIFSSENVMIFFDIFKISTFIIITYLLF